ncbi:NAD-dependent deacylase [Luteolibacter ambystomatis]|uniref:NAD-dependent protein deacylase n=1 Tax=Luteolibacter ambystomatis TaxID=2824561 RepID=A0A975J204_9BACT|nr:NAD-dependent deacylase [Luteolibacter ambystomatis]QUE52567.1 NAD-dependent deacylase [Luteolibacter ambystomatis]
MKVVILTGAGISAESGVKTFRDNHGLWEGHRVEDVATPEAFGRNSALVHDFYNQRRRQLSEVIPNAAHQALVELEKYLGNDFLLITQNVDDLHERAGSERVLHMHGELLKKRCVWCEVVTPCETTTSLDSTDLCEACGRDLGMRPDIVWFGEMPYYLDRIEIALRDAEVFIAIGTSAVVYPAAQFFAMASMHGAKTIEVNLAATARSNEFDQRLFGPATETVPKLVAELIAAR